MEHLTGHRRSKHTQPDLVFWVSPKGRFIDAGDAHLRRPPKGFAHILQDEPHYGGFLRGRVAWYGEHVTEGTEAHYGTLEGIADVDGDGRMELVLSHHRLDSHVHERVVYSWSPAGLRALASDLQVERDCYESADWVAP